MNYIQKFIYNLSIDKKLLMLSMLTAIVAVVLTCSAFIVFILYEERRDLINDMLHIGNLTQADISNAITNKNISSVNQHLLTISLRESIVQACIFDRSGKTIAHIDTNEATMKCSNIPTLNKNRYEFLTFDQKYLFVKTDLKDRGVRIGSLYTVSSLKLISQKIIRSLYNSIFVLIIIIAICYKVSQNLQKNVSEPILYLASVSYSVKSGDFGIRAKYDSEDEIGALTESFNNMLNVIQDAKENLELKVVERTKQHEKAVQAKTEFLSNMSHEIRTPIHGIMNYAEFLVNDWNSFKEEKRFSFLSKIYHNSNRLLSLINNLLDISKLDANKMDFHFFNYDVKEIVEDIIIEMEPLYLAKDIKIDFINNIEGNSNVDCDKERITQVMRNLLSNAIKFTNQGNITITLNSTILFDRIGDDRHAVEFSVQDNGIGIPENESEYIFDKFSQSTKTKTGAGGTGLGLAICKDIIKAHNGKIWAENNKNSPGAILRFIIPRKQINKNLPSDEPTQM